MDAGLEEGRGKLCVREETLFHAEKVLGARTHKTFMRWKLAATRVALERSGGSGGGEGMILVGADVVGGGRRSSCSRSRYWRRRGHGVAERTTETDLCRLSAAGKKLFMGGGITGRRMSFSEDYIDE